jgi:predicted NAD/FAD-dependent oxidoreductase
MNQENLFPVPPDHLQHALLLRPFPTNMNQSMDSTERHTDVLVIGAGMAGLIAAAELQRSGLRVLILDKSRAVGGRMASRRIDGATFDHGAQFITTRDPRFAAVLEQTLQNGALKEWCRGFSGREDGHARWCGIPGMSAVAKHLATGLELHLEMPVTALKACESRWNALTSTGRTYTSGAVLLTPPVPQSLALLDAGGVVLAPEMHRRLATIQYERCLAVMAILDGRSLIPHPGALSLNEGPIAWIADNQTKGISSEPALTIHATHAFSMEQWDCDRQSSGRTLLAAAAKWIGESSVKTFQVHGWRYSKPLSVDESPCLLAYDSPPLVIAGDAFAGPKVEGAALSGWAAAEMILKNRNAF